MPSVDIGGVNLFYDERGAGEPIVFVHGIPTDYRAWTAQMGPLSNRYRTIALSRRYSFPNDRKGDVMDSTVDNNAEDISGFIESLGIAPAHVVGHSYGGFAAAMLAERHPEQVRSLVLVEPAVSTVLLTDAGSKGQMLSLLLRSPSVALAARRFQTGSLYPSLRSLDSGELEKAVQLNVDGLQDGTMALSKFPAEVRQMMLDNARTIGELRTRFPRFTALEAAKISRRTLVINGASSPLWLRRIGELLAHAVPGAERTVIPGTRHFPHVENAELFNSKVLDFLGRSIDAN